MVSNRDQKRSLKANYLIQDTYTSSESTLLYFKDRSNNELNHHLIASLTQSFFVLHCL